MRLSAKLGKQVSAWVREKLPKGPEVTLIWEGRQAWLPLVRVITPEGQYTAETHHRASHWTQDIL